MTDFCKVCGAYWDCEHKKKVGTVKKPIVTIGTRVPIQAQPDIESEWAGLP